MTTPGIHFILEKYKTGHRYFINLDFAKGEELTGQILSDITFDNCFFSVDFAQTDFRNAKFINCNLKVCNFSGCDLSDCVFENCSFEETEFVNASIERTTLINCYYYGQIVSLNKETRKLETFKTLLVKELYENVPEFDRIADHFNDELDYIVYGELSLKLFDEITTNNELTTFTKDCFQFFNLIGNRGDEKIDNLLVVGVYEGLYANKKCNDISRQLLVGRNKDVYEYWMINGSIRANY